MRTVKIGKAEYLKVKALALRRGQFLSYVLNQAIRAYIESDKTKP